MSAPSALLRSLLGARPDAPAGLRRFDAEVRAGARGPSFEEYSARIGEGLGPWRETCYFDVDEPGAGEVAHERLLAVAAALGVALPAKFVARIRAGATLGPEVLQVVLGYDEGGAATRLKYYLVFRAGSDALVERVRAAVDAPPLPAELAPSSVYILGLDFAPQGLVDFKIYVRLDMRRAQAAIRNLDAYAGLWRGCRSLVYQRCLVGGGRQVYFHATAAGVIEGELEQRARREPAAAALIEQLGAMNRTLGRTRWRPWIASYPLEAGLLRPAPSNVYFHLEEDDAASQGRTGRG